jgi:hypothetical protein
MANSRIVNTPSQAIAQNGTTHAQKTISSTAVAVLPSALNAGTTHVLVQVNAADVRVTFDGATDPTNSVGFLMPSGSSAYWTKNLAVNAKAIRTASTDAVFEVQELNFL